MWHKLSLKLNITAWAGVGKGRGEGQITGATYILLDELRINQAGSRDQLVGIKVDQVVAGLCREKVEEAGIG